MLTLLTTCSDFKLEATDLSSMTEVDAICGAIDQRPRSNLNYSGTNDHR